MQVYPRSKATTRVTDDQTGQHEHSTSEVLHPPPRALTLWGFSPNDKASPQPAQTHTWEEMTLGSCT